MLSGGRVWDRRGPAELLRMPGVPSHAAGAFAGQRLTVSRAVELCEPALGATRVLALCNDVLVICFDADLLICSLQGSLFDTNVWSQDLLGRPLADGLPARHLALFRPACEAALQGETSSLALEASARGDCVVVNVEPVRLHSGTIVGGILIAREVASCDVHHDPSCGWTARSVGRGARR